MKYYLLCIITILSGFIITWCNNTNIQSGWLNTDQLSISHDGLQFVPNIIKLKKGKKYEITVTPTSDGRWCMQQVVLPDSTIVDIIKDQPFIMNINADTAKTIPLVCASMGMKQWEITIE